MSNVVALNTNRNNNVSVFEFDERPIRTIDRGGEVWFFANDVCTALEISNPRHAISRLDEDEKGVAINDTLGGAQETSTISESGLYSLILTSRKSEAKRFKRWVTHDVLPAIRKDGAYVMGEENTHDYDDLLAQTISTINRKLDRLAVELEDVRPKAQAWEAFVNSDGLYGLQNAGRALGLKPKLFIKWLRGQYLFRQCGVLVPKQPFLKQGLFELKNNVFEEHSKLQTYITPKGLEHLNALVPDELRVDVGREEAA